MAEKNTIINEESVEQDKVSRQPETKDAATVNIDDIDVDAMMSESDSTGLFETLAESEENKTAKATGTTILEIEDLEAEGIIDESTFISNNTGKTQPPPKVVIEAEFEEVGSEVIEPIDDKIEEPVSGNNTERINNPIEVNEEEVEKTKSTANDKKTTKDEKTTIKTNMTPEEVKARLKGANSEHYYAIHQGDAFEQALADKMNEFEQRKTEAEARINMLYGQRKELRDKINGRGFWQKAVNFALVKPFRGLWRLFQKVIGRGNRIRYSPEEIELQGVKQKIKEEKARVIHIENEQKQYVKAMEIDVQQGAPVIIPQPTTKEPINQNNEAKQANKNDVEKPAENKNIDNENKDINPNEMPEAETKKEETTKNGTERREPNTTKIFEQMMQKVYGEDAFSAHGSKNGIMVDITDKAGNMHKFVFNHGKGELTPQSFGVEGGLEQDVVDKLSKDAYIAYTLAAAKTGKPLVNENYVQTNLAPKIEKMLNGETKYANFKLGCIPVSIAAQENGTYAIKFNYDKNNKTQDLTIFTDASQLKSDKLPETIAAFRASYAMSMYKSMVSEKFIDFMKASKVVKNLHKAKLDNFEKKNNTISFNITLQENENAEPVTVPATFSTNNFEAHVSDEHINLLNGTQKIALAEAVKAVERGYSSFILTNCHIMPETVLPAPMDVMQEMNENIESVKDGEEKNFYAYGIIFNVNKKDSEYPVVTVSGKDGIVMNREPLYTGKMDANSIAEIYNGIATSMTIEADNYNKQEASYMNREQAKNDKSVADSVLDENYANNDGMSQGDVSRMVNDIIEASMDDR